MTVDTTQPAQAVAAQRDAKVLSLAVRNAARAAHEELEAPQQYPTSSLHTALRGFAPDLASWTANATRLAAETSGLSSTARTHMQCIAAALVGSRQPLAVQVSDQPGDDVDVDDYPHLCCAITNEVMIDPVITPDGHTYDRVYIEAWLGQGTNSDPLTRRPLTASQLIPNLNVRQAVHLLRFGRVAARRQLQQLAGHCEAIWEELK